MATDYYVLLHKKELGKLGLFTETKELGKYNTQDEAVQAMRSHGDGNYHTVTYWDGKRFDHNEFKVDSGVAYIATSDGWLRFTSSRSHLNDYTLPGAIVWNPFYAKDVRRATASRLKLYIESRKPKKKGKPKHSIVRAAVSRLRIKKS